MKFFKIGLLLLAAAAGLFAFACGDAQVNNSTNNATTTAGNRNAATASADSTTATTNAQPTATAAAVVDEFAEARTIYLETCVKCHKEDGSGGEATFEGKKIKVPSYKSPGAMKASDDKLYNYIANGEEGEMPAFKDRLSETQMRDLVKFIRREFQGK
jgi:mono/diheme cytochrome c family protein